MKKVSIFWHRRDLRLHDNVGLYNALKEQENVLPIFIFDSTILDRLENKSDPRVSFIHQKIVEMKSQYKELGGDLHVFYGTPEEIFKILLNAHNIESVYTNRDYEPYARIRDQKIEELLRTHTIELKTYKDHVLFEPGEVLKDNGEPYRVYTPYSKRVLACIESEGLQEPVIPDFSNLVDVVKQDVPALEDMGFANSTIQVPQYNFSTEFVKDYKQRRDIPSDTFGTSKLSPHLRFGTVSVRELASVGLKHEITFLKELIWREFFQQLLWYYPHTPKEEFKKQYAGIEWRNNKQEFEAWKEGETGYPIVDAGMRELAATGLMHNRVRMITASFLIKHLLVDWRWGERYFAEKLLDYELASNVGNWQWVCGSGADASPYFRVFNPYLQQKKFDPDFEYIKKWIPEYGTDQYPTEIVEHDFARKRCLETFKKALNADPKYEK